VPHFTKQINRLRNSDFSRIDFQLAAYTHHQTNVVKDLKVILPPKATNVFYRDDIGNVSTSNFHQTAKNSILHIRPRYPLYGGWRYAWHHTYDVPLDGFVKSDKKQTGRFVLQVPFAGAIANVSIETVFFKVVLPEGAT
jgi:oligosaccharyltransferase complex subunit alpha (ribophorin I)